MLRFIHGADLHFDRSFEGLTGLAPAASQRLPQINQEVLANIVEVACERKVDFVLLAGDTFHQSRPSLKAQGELLAAFHRLAAAEIPVYLIFGNHDYYDAQRYWFDFPDNVHLFTSSTVTSFSGTSQSGETYEITGFSYQERFETKNKLKEFPSRGSAVYQIGMYHGDAGGSQYAPFSLGEMREKGYDYWALGHIHVPTILSEHPPILYPGAPQGHTRKETEAGFVTYVELTPGSCHKEALPVASWLWQKIRLDVSHCHNQKELLAFVEAELTSLVIERPAFLQVVLDQVTGDNQTMNALGNGEVQEYLNQVLWQQQPPRQIAKLQQAQTLTGKNRLPLPKNQVERILHLYQDPDIFGDLLQELALHPVAGNLLSRDEQYQATVLAAAEQLLATDFLLEDEE